MTSKRTAEKTARMYLFGGNQEEAARKSGLTMSTWKRRKKQPWKITLSEMAGMAHYYQLTDEEIATVVRAFYIF